MKHLYLLPIYLLFISSPLRAQIGIHGDVTLKDNSTAGFFGPLSLVDGIVESETDATETLSVNGTAQITGALKDSSGDAGTTGQLLSTTANGTNWVDAPTSNTDSQTITFGSSATSTETTLAIEGGNALTLQAAGNLSFNQTNTGTLEFNVTDNRKFVDGTNTSNAVYTTGNVGIGTPTPAETLTVSGTAQITGALKDSSGDAGTAGQVLSSTTTSTQWITFDASSLTDADGDTQVQVEEGTNDDTIRFDTAGNERMVITADGKVGIGTNTPVGPFEIIAASTTNTITGETTAPSHDGTTWTTLLSNVSASTVGSLRLAALRFGLFGFTGGGSYNGLRHPVQ